MNLFKSWLFKTLLILSFLGLILFLVLKNYGFISDDYFIFFSSLKNPFPFKEDWLNSGWGFYRPLLVFSFYLNYLIAGFDSKYFYLINLLIHIIATLEVVYMIKNIRFINIKSNNYLIITGIVYFILPQNLMNVFWISGRTDLLCGIFVFAALISYLFYSRNYKLRYLLLFIVFTIASLLTKESGVIINIYILIFLIIELYFYKNKLKIKYILITLFIINLFYIYVRYKILILDFPANPMENINMYNSIKFYLYGAWSLFIPIDILDFFNLSFFSTFLFNLVSIVVFIYCFSFLLLLFRKINHIKVNLFILMTAILSITIYIMSFPSMRLMYIHIPLIIIVSVSIICDSPENKSLKSLFLFTLFLFLFLGNYNTYSKYSEINNYSFELSNIVPSEKIKNNRKVINLFSMSRIGQAWSMPDLNYMYAYRNDSLKLLSSKFVNLFDFEISPYYKYKDALYYKKINDSSFAVIANNDTYFLLKNIEIFMKINDSSYTYDNKYFLSFNKYSAELRKNPVEMNIHYHKQFINDIDVIYIDSGVIKFNSFENFLKQLK